MHPVHGIPSLPPFLQPPSMFRLPHASRSQCLRHYTSTALSLLHMIAFSCSCLLSWQKMHVALPGGNKHT